MTGFRVSLTPTAMPLVWPTPRSLATTSGISVDFFSSPYLDVSVQAVPHVHLCVQCTLTRYCRAGFPHSEISGSSRMCRSPKLIAACHVLHRLLMPRHSPCALSSLTCFTVNSCSQNYAGSQRSLFAKLLPSFGVHNFFSKVHGFPPCSSLLPCLF